MTQANRFEPQSKSTAAVKRSWKSAVILSLLLFGVSAAVFWPACFNSFVNVDDREYIIYQPHVLNGLRWDGILWAATARVADNWHPLTMLSLQTDVQLFGAGPQGFHRTAVLMHAVNAALVFLMLLRLTGSVWRSVAVAALFAVHPFRVESVAWISERKDLLSGLFFCLTILAYCRHTAGPSRSRYAVVAVLMMLGLMSKPMLVTTPCVLLLLDYWPLDRMRSGSRLPQDSRNESPLSTDVLGGIQRVSTTERRPLLGLIIEKVPLFLIAAVSSVITVVYQGAGIRNFTTVPFQGRIVNAIVGYGDYLAQTFWPTDLSPFYGIKDVSIPKFSGSLLLLLALTGLSIWQRTRRPYLLVGWFWFLGMLFPVCGLMQTGDQARADRYTYLPHIGLFIAVVWCLADAVRQSRRAMIASACLVTVFFTACSFVTVRQISVWHDSLSLLRQIHERNPDKPVFFVHLIYALIHQGKNDEALRKIDDRLLVTDESDANTLSSLAELLARLGAYEASSQTLGKAIKYHPDMASLYFSRAKAEGALDNWEAAVDDCRRASELLPKSAPIQFFLALALRMNGQNEQSREMYAGALRESPKWPYQAIMESWRMSNDHLLKEGAFWPACLAEQAIEATGGDDPRFLEALAAAYAYAGRFSAAIATTKQAIEQYKATNQTASIAVFQQRLELYENQLQRAANMPRDTVWPSRMP